MMCEIRKDNVGKTRLRWQCPLCTHHWDLHASAIDEMAFFVVHHLVGKHDYTAKQLLAYDPSLAEAIEEYLGPDAIESSIMKSTAAFPNDHPVDSPARMGRIPGGVKHE